MMKKCPNCEKRYEEQRQFCSECGSELVSLSVEELRVVNEQKAKGKNKTIAIVISTVVVLVAIFIMLILPKMQANAAVDLVEEETGYRHTGECCNYLKLSSGGEYFVVVKGYTYYFVRKDGLWISDYVTRLHTSASSEEEARIHEKLNEYYLDLLEDYVNVIITGEYVDGKYVSDNGIVKGIRL